MEGGFIVLEYTLAKKDICWTKQLKKLHSSCVGIDIGKHCIRDDYLNTAALIKIVKVHNQK